VTQPFVHTLRPRYAECDREGIVFNAHYLTYFDLSITELWRAAFGGYRVMLDRGLDIVLAEAQLRFLKPAKFDEELALEIEITHLGTTSMVSRHVVRHEADLIAEAELRHVFVDLESVEKAAIPDWAREGLQPWCG
jgi:acyl-CoA thioester hydrolase